MSLAPASGWVRPKEGLGVGLVQQDTGVLTQAVLHIAAVRPTAAIRRLCSLMS